MRLTGWRALLALVAAILALAGVERRASAASSVTSDAVTARTVSARAAGLAPGHAASRAFRHAGAPLTPAVRVTVSPPGRFPLRGPGGQPVVFGPLASPFRSTSASARPLVPAFARHLAAARDGTLSSRSTGLPPPLS